ncbi:MAG: thioredoxin [Armatimonadota bacterium]|nr:thioredoxin [bacterium]MDW8321737.1 thioredoxin [Armatimonadota bacterium]
MGLFGLFGRRQASDHAESGLIKHVSASTFKQEVLESDIPVLVDFWAPWCAPCRMLAPILEEIAREYQGRLKVVKLNTDDNPITANAYGIQGIPTLILFARGFARERLVGLMPKQHILAKVLPYLSVEAPASVADDGNQ